MNSADGPGAGAEVGWLGGSKFKFTGESSRAETSSGSNNVENRNGKTVSIHVK